MILVLSASLVSVGAPPFSYLVKNAVLYSQLTQFPVTVDPASGAATFVFNDPNVNLPKPTDRSYRVFIGFDEGAPKAVKKAGS
jgi:hypothetical protein